MRKLLKRLSLEILRPFDVIKKEIKSLHVEIRGLRSFDQYFYLMDFFKTGISGVKSVIHRRIKGNTLSLIVKFSGTTDCLFKSFKGE